MQISVYICSISTGKLFKKYIPHQLVNKILQLEGSNQNQNQNLHRLLYTN